MGKHHKHTAKYDSVFKVNPNLKPLAADHPVVVQKQKEFNQLLKPGEQLPTLKGAAIPPDQKGLRRPSTAQRIYPYTRLRQNLQAAFQIIRILATSSVVHLIELIKKTM